MEQKENNWNQPLIDRFDLAGKITVEHAKYIEFILEKIVAQAISEERERIAKEVNGIAELTKDLWKESDSKEREGGLFVCEKLLSIINKQE